MKTIYVVTCWYGGREITLETAFLTLKAAEKYISQVKSGGSYGDYDIEEIELLEE